MPSHLYDINLISVILDYVRNREDGARLTTDNEDFGTQNQTDCIFRWNISRQDVTTLDFIRAVNG